MKVLDVKLFKFLLVGVINTVFGAGIMFVLYNLFGVSYWISSICNYVFGGILSFFLNKFFTFQNNKKSVKQIVLFVLTILTCYLIAYMGAKNLVYAILKIKSDKLLDNIAMLSGMCVYTALNYIAQRFIVFKEVEK